MEAAWFTDAATNNRRRIFRLSLALPSHSGGKNTGASEDPAAQIARGPRITFRYATEHPQLLPIMLRVVLDVEGHHADIKDAVREDIRRGKRLGRFIVEDVDLAAEFCASLVGAMLQLSNGFEDPKRIGFLTTVDTLVLLGVDRSDAPAVVERELDSFKDELANLDQEVSAG